MDGYAILTRIDAAISYGRRAGIEGIPSVLTGNMGEIRSVDGGPAPQDFEFGPIVVPVLDSAYGESMKDLQRVDQTDTNKTVELISVARYVSLAEAALAAAEATPEVMSHYSTNRVAAKILLQFQENRDSQAS